MKLGSFAFASTFLMVVGLSCLPAASQAQPVRPTLLVMLQNDANVESDLAAKAQSEVARLFDLIDVDLLWVTEVPAAGTRLRVISLTTWEPPDKIPASVLGYTQVAPGKRGTGPTCSGAVWNAPLLVSPPVLTRFWRWRSLTRLVTCCCRMASTRNPA